jgi:hypothetical protein
MNTCVRTFLVKASSAIAVALLAFSFTGAPSAVRADDPQAPRPEMVMISTLALDGLDQRVSYLEGLIASLTLSSQHFSPHQLCVSDDSGAETCVTKAQLDALLANHAPAAEIAHSAAPVGVEGRSAAKEPAAATTEINPEPSAPIAANEILQSEPETTGSISAAAAPAAEPSAPPDIETPKSNELP